MLEIVDEDDVEYPVEPQENIEDDGAIVPPRSLKQKHVAEKRLPRFKVAETPVDEYVPETAVQAVH